MSLLNANSTAIFTTCDDANITRAITSLLSARKFSQTAQLFLFSRNISSTHQALLEQNKINYCDVDLRGDFPRHWHEPVERFYLFYGPEYLLKHQFSYSIFIHPDYKFSADPLRLVNDLPAIDGIKVKDTIKAQSPLVSTNLIFFNNNRMEEVELFKTSAKLFQDSLTAGTPLDTQSKLLLEIQKTRLASTEIHSTISSFFTIRRQHKHKSTPSTGFSKQEIKTLENEGFRYPSFRKKCNHRSAPIKALVSENEKLGILNFGDQLTKDLIPTLFGYRIEPHPGAKNVDLFAVGSVLFEIPNMSPEQRSFCWGSGFISDEPILNEQSLLQQITFTAVRGQLTLQRIRQVYPNLDIPLGDPGLLASVLFSPSQAKTDRVGIVPHYIDSDNMVIQKLRADKRFLVIDPLDPPATVAKQISGCKLILSSSLHGMIFADSYGIPNAHIKLSNKVYGGEYKFKDYDSGVGKKHIDADVKEILNESYIDSLINQYNPIANLKLIQKNLVASFPYK